MYVPVTICVPVHRFPEGKGKGSDPMYVFYKINCILPFLYDDQGGIYFPCCHFVINAVL